MLPDMETVVNIHDAKTHFSRLVERAEHGERITIARAGRPVAMLVALERETRLERPLGMDRGRVIIHDTFDEPRPEWDAAGMDPDDPLNWPRR
jgi:prevent-host-death family protein